MNYFISTLQHSFWVKPNAMFMSQKVSIILAVALLKNKKNKLWQIHVKISCTDIFLWEYCVVTKHVDYYHILFRYRTETTALLAEHIKNSWTPPSIGNLHWQRWSRGHKARGQGQGQGHKKKSEAKAKAKDSLFEDIPSRGQGQECSRPRPRTKDTAASVLRKKRSLNIFSGDLLFISGPKIFEWGTPKPQIT